MGKAWERTDSMRRVKVDLHLHSVLSPCAELEMGPVEIIEAARSASLDVIAITDHNSCLNYPALASVAGTEGPLVIAGMEIQTVEDIHVVTLFPSYEKALLCQNWLWSGLPDVKNRVDLFGYQLVVDGEGNILEEVEVLLLQGAKWTVDEVVSRVHELGGIAILAHVDRPAFSYPSVLGFIPDELEVEALELSRNVGPNDLARWYEDYPSRTFIRSSDSHRLSEVDSAYSIMEMKEPSFRELLMALSSSQGRRVI